MNNKTAVVLMNLGGPDTLDSVYGFLRNLFNDPAILNLPGPFRNILSYIIAKKRTPLAKEIYKQIGGSSPILTETISQAKELEKFLDSENIKVFVSMRYWHPFSSETIRLINKWRPSRVLIIPLYPQFSTTTTGSSIDDWTKNSKLFSNKVQTRIVCCYPIDKLFISAHLSLIKKELSQIKEKNTVRLIFSAHGLPESIIKKGDPYAWQVQETVKSIINNLNLDEENWVLSYQSKVTPVKWLEPSTEYEIIRASKDKKKVIIIPIAFVSEHSETLVELDKEYYDLAISKGITYYKRVPALGIQNQFIKCLAEIIRNNLNNFSDNLDINSSNGIRLCPTSFKNCRVKGI
ncbi:MAG: Ferrochelatase [Alphaproteobacteria bacterium MarineAlpha2_Bin1]|nr:MAG: Ferrochelatase [Alphaproteobacteria bacterium MarineAlpha2_Bin1]|tara:strand:- start:497 stop:1540 length:1044 start_codon:yes stop_codon:yes gene_type:complete